MKRPLLGCGVALAMIAWSGLASADITKAQCVDANTNGQAFRRDGKLEAARVQFQTCSDPKCPEVVRTDCTQRIDELELAMPAILFEVKMGDGTDVVDVKISADGKVIAERNDGTPRRVEPGPHEFTFAVAGQAPVVKSFVLKEGEKSRQERIVIGPVAPPPAPPPVVLVPAPKPASSGANSDLLRYGGLGVAAAGVVALGVGIFYGVKASGKWSDQQDHCQNALDCPNRPQAISDHDGAVVYGRFSTIGLIAGGVLLAGGVALFLLAPRSDRSDPRTGRFRDPLRFSF